VPLRLCRVLGALGKSAASGSDLPYFHLQACTKELELYLSYSVALR
jgi:hypothetical protein